MRSFFGPTDWRDKRGRKVCDCFGYHFPHRKGGGACDHSKTRDYHLAVRFGDPDAYLYLPAVKADECPF